MNLDFFKDIFDAGMLAIPIIWDGENKMESRIPEHDLNKIKIDEHYIASLLKNGFANCNGVALKLKSPFGMFDFDLKNTENKKVFDDWKNIIAATNEDILNKVCIESTRNGGYHVYIKYVKLNRKINAARHEGKEVIAVYTGELLSYTHPTPGYEILHGSLSDLEELTDEEYELLWTTATLFNEDKEYTPGEPTVKLIDYPTEYEAQCLSFDAQCSDEMFETILNSIDLYRVRDSYLGLKNGKQTYVPFLRKNSKAKYSAKVYFHQNKSLLIFSASMVKFPTWHDADKSGDKKWVLSPAKIIYYKNDKDWTRAMEEISMICDSVGIDLPKPVKENIIPQDRLKFPYDIFPETITNFISYLRIQNEYIAAGILGAVSGSIGNTVVLKAMDGYMVKPIIYLVLVAPPGSMKTPALKKAFDPLWKYDEKLYNGYAQLMQTYKEQLAAHKADKKQPEPEKPSYPQVVIQDSTIEMVIKILSVNPLGCCIFADELRGFLKRMNQYKDGDEVQKWLEMWSGSPILLQRISRDENRVKEPYCSIVGGIQPGVLQSLASKENEHNGFYHRFLFCYPNPEPKKDWEQIKIPYYIIDQYTEFFNSILSHRTNPDDKHIYQMTDETNGLYKSWFEYKNKFYNRTHDDNVKGIIAKYQDYCLRFALLIQVMHDGEQRTGIIEPKNMERAIRLTEYFLGNMHKALEVLTPATPVDKLSQEQKIFYRTLPATFSHKTAIETAKTLNIKENTVKSYLNRWCKLQEPIIKKLESGGYELLF